MLVLHHTHPVNTNMLICCGRIQLFAEACFSLNRLEMTSHYSRTKAGITTATAQRQLLHHDLQWFNFHL